MSVRTWSTRWRAAVVLAPLLAALGLSVWLLMKRESPFPVICGLLAAWCLWSGFVFRSGWQWTINTAGTLTSGKTISPGDRSVSVQATDRPDAEMTEFDHEQVPQFSAEETLPQHLKVQQTYDLMKIPELARELRDLAWEAQHGVQESLDALRNGDAVFAALFSRMIERAKRSLTAEEHREWACFVNKTHDLTAKLQEVAWIGLTASANACEARVPVENIGFDAELPTKAQDTLQEWLRQTGFPTALLKVLNLLKYDETQIENFPGVWNSPFQWWHKSFAEWLAGQHLVENEEARTELPKLLGDPRCRDTVRYALSAASRQRKSEALDELVRMLISQGRVFWVWEALRDDGLGRLRGPARAHPQATGMAPELETLCRWLVHRDLDGCGAWRGDCPLKLLEKTIALWPTLFDRPVREGRVLYWAWEMVGLASRSECSLVRQTVEDIRRRFLGEWPVIQHSQNPVTGAALDLNEVEAMRSLAWEPLRDLSAVDRDKDISEPRYCRVPPEGAVHRFTMGSPQSEPGRSNDEVRMEYSVHAFWLGSFPVTNAAYELFDPRHRERRTERSLSESQPVVNVSRYEAEMLCVWLGGTYRLPTEVEWEAACRSGTQSAYWFGDNPAELGQHAWFGGNSGGRTHNLQEALSKGRRPGEGHMNGWALVDMHGNVWEWCSGDTPVGPPCPYRGGSWYLDAKYCRAAFRSGREPRQRSGFLGLRLVSIPSHEPRVTPPEA